MQVFLGMQFTIVLLNIMKVNEITFILKLICNATEKFKAKFEEESALKVENFIKLSHMNN